MGVLEYEHYSYPVDDRTLAHLHAVLSVAVEARGQVEVVLQFAADDRIRLRISPSSRCTVYVHEWPELCDDCVEALETELEASGCLTLVARDVGPGGPGLRRAAGRVRVRRQSAAGGAPNC